MSEYPVNHNGSRVYIVCIKDDMIRVFNNEKNKILLIIPTFKHIFVSDQNNAILIHEKKHTYIFITLGNVDPYTKYYKTSIDSQDNWFLMKYQILFKDGKAFNDEYIEISKA